MAKMIFKGDLSKYHPADAMMFLSQAGSDGVHVLEGPQTIPVAFREAFKETAT